MPVLVVGADTPLGNLVMSALADRQGEIRAFVTDPDVGAELKMTSVKVAVGDVSDPSHVGAAALHCHSVVLLPEAALDDRERSFAETPQQVLSGWVEAIAESGAQRAIWVEVPETEGSSALLSGLDTEVAIVRAGGRSPSELADLIVELDDTAELPTEYRLG